jgi:hypothetical protein
MRPLLDSPILPILLRAPLSLSLLFPGIAFGPFALAISFECGPLGLLLWAIGVWRWIRLSSSVGWTGSCDIVL